MTNITEIKLKGVEATEHPRPEDYFSFDRTQRFEFSTNCGYYIGANGTTVIIPYIVHKEMNQPGFDYSKNKPIERRIITITKTWDNAIFVLTGEYSDSDSVPSLSKGLISQIHSSNPSDIKNEYDNYGPSLLYQMMFWGTTEVHVHDSHEGPYRYILDTDVDFRNYPE